MKGGVRSGRQRALDWEVVRRRLDAALSTSDLNDIVRAKATLEERARNLARPPADTSVALSKLELVGFALSGERYAIETNCVRQVLKLRDLIRLPGAPEHLLGLTNLSGEVLPVFDLRVLLGLPRTHLSDMSRLLVLGNGSPELGILADRVDEITWLDQDDVLQPPAALSREGRAYMHGVTRQAVIVLDGRVLLHDPRLFLGSADPNLQRMGE